MLITSVLYIGLGLTVNQMVDILYVYHMKIGSTMPNNKKRLLTDEQWIISHKALVEASKFVGGQGKLSELLGVSRQAVNRFVKCRRLLPIERAIQIEQITNGKVKKSKLRPDIF